MESRNKTKSSQGAGLRAALDFLQRTNDCRDELRRERDNAVRAEQPDLALQYSQDLRQCHDDYLWIGLKLVSIRRARIHSRSQYQGRGSARHQLLIKLLGPEAGEISFRKWQEANEESEVHGLANENLDGAVTDPLTDENLTPESVWKEFLARMEDEKIFLEKLKNVAQQTGNYGLTRGCRQGLRDFDKVLFERRTEINKFEEGNPPPVDHLAREAERCEARERLISKIRDLAIAQGILSKDGRPLPAPGSDKTPENDP